MNTRDKHEQEVDEKAVNTGAFFVFSFVPYFFWFVALSAAQDILADTDLPTASVLLADCVPYFVASLTLPYFVDKLTQLRTTVAITGLDLLGAVLLALVDKRSVQLIAICLFSLADAIADTCLLSSSALYTEVTVNAYSAGAGFGQLAAALYYTGELFTFQFTCSRNCLRMMQRIFHHTN